VSIIGNNFENLACTGDNSSLISISSKGIIEAKDNTFKNIGFSE